MHEPERFRSSEYLAVLDAAAPALRCRISPAAVQAMREAAESGYPEEVCGLLIGSLDGEGWNVQEARQVDNLNRERAADRFQLDPAGYQAVDRELRGSGREIVGVFHSHPDCPARPSPTDLENGWEGFLYPIVSVCNGSVADLAVWALNGSGNKFQGVDYTTDA